MIDKPKKEEIKKESCFVIMPFGGYFDEYYNSIYIPAIENSGLNPVRADDIYRPSTIVQDIWELTKRAKIVLADLTDKNPNVFYELGLAHSLAKPAILVAESEEFIPFDLRALRVIVYNKNLPNWGDNLRRKIERYIKETIKSPIKSVLPAFLDIEESVIPKKITKQEKELLEIRQDIELLKQDKFSTSKYLHPIPILGQREVQLLRLLSEGVPMKKMIEYLPHSYSSITRKKRMIMERLDIFNDFELIDFYRKNEKELIENARRFSRH